MSDCDLPENQSAVRVMPSCSWRVQGKFFDAGAQRISLNGVTYGPFPPNGSDDFYPNRTQVEADFQRIGELGANVLRCYTVPPDWFFDLAERQHLRLLVDIPWSYQLAFLDESFHAAEAVRAMKRFAARFGGHPALFAACVANEIPPDIVRWSGAERVGKFLDQLVCELKEEDDSILATYCGYPSTEYLVPRECDFMCFNVYLHDLASFSNYLARLQTIAGPKPLVLGEVGFDSLHHGPEGQAKHLEEQLRVARAESVAGTFVYSFCDEWYKDGKLVTDWAFGLVTSTRASKPSYETVQAVYDDGASAEDADLPFVSVVVAAYRAAATLRACLESLVALDYPAYEVIVIDDGSTDGTWEIVESFEGVRGIRHTTNHGLSAARNSGIESSQGKIIAFTDADCRVDRAWLRHLVLTLEGHSFKGVGGHNLLPVDSSRLAVLVGVAPGGPIHVMLTDRVAEHVPGCNMAFYRDVLKELGGFDPRFRVAGDDVDLCWRLQQQGHQIGFSSGGFVWHERRSSVGAYLRQQMGYGRAEALLAQKFPALFNGFGDHTWRGRIYDESVWFSAFSRPVVYRGIYGRGLFQMIPFGRASVWATLLVSLEYHVLFVGGSFLLGFINPSAWILTGMGLLGSICICVGTARRVYLPRQFRSLRARFLVGCLYFLQPVVRSFARYRAQWGLPGRPEALVLKEASGGWLLQGWREIRKQYWSEAEGDRPQLISGFLDRLSSRGWSVATDDGFQNFDVSARIGVWGSIEFLSAEEFLPGNRRQIRARLRVKGSTPTIGILVLGLIGSVLGIGWGPGSGWLTGLWLLPWLGLLGWLGWRVRGALREAERLMDATAIAIGLLDVDRKSGTAQKE